MRKLTLTFFLASAAPAFAHSGDGAVRGLNAGLTHPFMGLDHLLVMLAVGLWSGFALKERKWRGVAFFLFGMMLGAFAAMMGMVAPGAEAFALVSVLLMGALLVFSKPNQGEKRNLAALLAIAGFAACHGFLHVQEAQGSYASYVFGFLMATVFLHIAGYFAANLARQFPKLPKVIGYALALAAITLSMS